MNAFSGKQVAKISGLDYRYIKTISDLGYCHPVRSGHSIFYGREELYALSIVGGLRRCNSRVGRGNTEKSHFYYQVAGSLLADKSLLNSPYLIIQDSKSIVGVDEEEVQCLCTRSQGFLVDVNYFRREIDSKIASLVS